MPRLRVGSSSRSRGALFACFVTLSLIDTTAGPASGQPSEVGGELAGSLSRPDAAPVPVQLRYFREQIGQGRMRVRLGEGGELFVGEYLRVHRKAPVARLRRFYQGWTGSAFDDLRAGPLGSPWVRDEWTIEIFRERLAGSVVANLIGDRGGRMRCRFELVDDAAGLAGGASGACQTNSGLHVRFPTASPKLP